MASLRLDRLASLVGGALLGDASAEVTRVAPPEAAGEGSVAVVIDRRHLDALERIGATALVVPEGVTSPGRNLVTVPNPRRALVTLLEALHPEPRRAPGIHPAAVVSETARLGHGVSIGPGATVEAGAVLGDRVEVHARVSIGEGVAVGDDTVLFPNVVLYPGTRVGQRVRIHAGTVVGSDGFGYHRQKDGTQRKVPQVGGVVIEDDVEIGANAAIDRATLGVTRIGRGTKIDNLVQVGHNCDVGEDVCLVGQVGLSGSVKVGRSSVLAGQAGVGDHVTLAEGTVVGAQSGVHTSIGPGLFIGTPAVPGQKALRMLPLLPKLPEMRAAIRALERRVAELEAALERRKEEEPG